jgi:hypothetical protein
MIKKEFCLYSFSAILSVLGDYVVFFILENLGLHFLFCQGTSRIAGGAIAFLFNKKFSFSFLMSSTGETLKKFIILYGVSYSISLSLIYLFNQIFLLESFYAKIIADTSCFIFNFFCMKYYVYPKTAFRFLSQRRAVT